MRAMIIFSLNGATTGGALLLLAVSSGDRIVGEVLSTQRRFKDASSDNITGSLESCPLHPLTPLARSVRCHDRVNGCS